MSTEFRGLSKALDQENWTRLSFLIKKPVDKVKTFIEGLEKSKVTELLFLVKRFDLLTKYGLPRSGEYSKMWTYRDSCLDPVRVLLLRLYVEMGDSEIDSLLERMDIDDLERIQQSSKDSLEKLSCLDAYYYDDTKKFADELLNALRRISRKDLTKDVQNFKDEVCDAPILDTDHIFSNLRRRTSALVNSRDVIQPSSFQLETYPIDKNAQYIGYCLIINIVNVEGYSPRNGSDKDAADLERTFKNLRYNVDNTTFKDIKLADLQAELQSLQRNDFSKYSIFVTFLLSHGQKNSFLTADNKNVDIIEFQNYFKPSQFKSLIGKPKIFFIQACQGNKKFATFTMGDVKNESPPEEPSVEVSDDTLETDGKEERIPDEADFLIVTSTVQDYFSQRNIKKGGWFIQTLCEVLKNPELSRCEMDAIMKHVNCRLIKKTGASGQKQISTPIKNTLYKNCYLYPSDS